MGKPVITSLKEMRAIASMELGERFNRDWEIEEDATRDFIRFLANEEILFANAVSGRSKELDRAKAICFDNPVVQAAEAGYYLRMLGGLSDRYDFGEDLQRLLGQRAALVQHEDITKEELLHSYIEATMIMDGVDPVTVLSGADSSHNLIFGVNFTYDDRLDVLHDRVGVYKSAKNTGSFSAVKLDIMASTSGGDLNMDNFREELKDTKYDKWARSAFEDMLRGIYSADDIFEMCYNKDVDPIMLLSINGTPMAEIVKSSPLYDSSKTVREQAPRCAMAALLEGNASLEVRRYDPETDKVSDAVKAEVKPVLKEEFSFVRWLKRVFGFITGEPSRKQRMNSIGKSDTAIDNSDSQKDTLLRQSKDEDIHKGERLDIDQVENERPKLTMMFYPDKKKTNNKDMTKENGGLENR